MRVMIAGASGFIGSRLTRACLAAGHEVICGTRRPPTAAGTSHVPLDYSTAIAPESLARALRGVDVVVNAVGILRETGSQTFAALHVNGPRALFTAASQAGVRRIVQVSALGAEPDAIAAYHRSKAQADQALRALPVDWAIVQPSLVYGPGGASTRMFEMQATLPLIPLPAGGQQRVQPVHIDDLIACLRRLIESPAQLRCTVPVVGPAPMTLEEYLRGLRDALGLKAARTVSIPRAFMVTAAHLGDRIPGMSLSSETFGMLERGNVGDPAPLAQLLGRPPRALVDFIPAADRERARNTALLGWLSPMLRVSVAFMWLIAGIVSLLPHTVPASLELLAAIGSPPALAPVLLMGAALLNITLGVLTLLPWRARWLWSVQILLVLVYTAIISVRLPELWLEPFGPVAKNVPILALLLLLRYLEPRR